MVNTNLNIRVGGTNAVFGVDGSIVVHDMYFKSPLGTSKKWHTILFVPYGRGGAGFSVLDVTNPVKPLHLYSIYNDIINNRIYRMDHNQVISTYDYISNFLFFSCYGTINKSSDNYNDDFNGSGVDASKKKCANNENNYCYEGKSWTFPVQGIDKTILPILK